MCSVCGSSLDPRGGRGLGSIASGEFRYLSTVLRARPKSRAIARAERPRPCISWISFTSPPLGNPCRHPRQVSGDDAPAIEVAQFKPVIDNGRQQLLHAGHVVGLRFARRNCICRAAFRALGRHGNHLVAPNITTTVGMIREPGGWGRAWAGVVMLLSSDSVPLIEKRICHPA